jgi:signal transduction histidine kinase
VYRSRTGGNEWEALTKGLPQRDCYVNVLREAMANTARHARPTRVGVRLGVGGEAQLEVEDDGIGISANALRGNGLQNMSDRARALGGTCTITARKEGGTRVQWQVPLLP